MLHTGASYVPLREEALSMPEKETDGNDKHYLVEAWLKSKQEFNLQVAY